MMTNVIFIGRWDIFEFVSQTISEELSNVFYPTYSFTEFFLFKKKLFIF